MISSLLFYPNFIKENSTFYYYSTLTVKNYTKNTTIIFTNDNFGKKKKPRISPLEHSILVCLKTV